MMKKPRVQLKHVLYASWARTAVSFVASLVDPTGGNAVMGGTGQQRFSPKDTYTKQQAFITMNRLLNILLETSRPPSEDELWNLGIRMTTST